MATDISSGSNDSKSHHLVSATAAHAGQLMSNGQRLAKPLYLQRLEQALRLDGLIAQVERTLNNHSLSDELNANVSKQQTKAVKTRVYGLSKVKKNKKWLKNILLDKSDTSDSDADDQLTDDDIDANGPKADECIREMLRFHRLQKKVRKEFESDPQSRQYYNYSTSLISAPPPQQVSALTANKTATKRPNKTAIKAKKPKTSDILVATEASPSISAIDTVLAPIALDIIATQTAITTMSTLTSDTSTSFATITTTSTTTTTMSSTLTANPELLAAIEKPIKTEKILDDIPYDAQLPKDILQTESSVITSYVEPSSGGGGGSTLSYVKSAASVAAEAVSPVLPDDIFDTEESCGSSVLSQTLSQPTPTNVDRLTNFTMLKCATAPTTPTSLSPSSSPVVSVTKSAKRTAKKKLASSGAAAAVNHEEMITLRRRRLWVAIARKEIPRAHKQKQTVRKEALNNLKKMANWCQREKRKQTLQHQKLFCRDQYSRARRLTKEMILYWKRFDKVERDYRKRAEREAQEQMKIDIELLEAKRQQRKLNFLITQTELYAHFMSRKLSAPDDSQQSTILNQLEEDNPPVLSSGVVKDDFDAHHQKQEALLNAETALKSYRRERTTFDAQLKADRGIDLSDVSVEMDEELCEPKLFEGILKAYQLKGMNWLYNLYDKGINGILADEMGLGKTVQTIAFMATLAERLNIWGPFLIIAPSSTLHNWQQELTRFVPKFKVLPYWGNPNDRKVLRKVWNQKHLHREESPFHVLVTSYQLIVQDVKYFQRIKWLYMVLDEAQAIKSTSSTRWKVLLSFQCRNRLLLTGTPIQNTMAELWALLHFIMPSMFDSHEEFNEWFSKDIESHAEHRTGIDERHLSRLHMILKPFMLRRIKKDVENELSDKIEIKLYCGLSSRQEELYRALKHKISIEDLMATTTTVSSTTSSLMNLVMQFRKVCNHPNLFERRDVRSPYHMNLEPYVLPRLMFESGLCGDFFEYDSAKYQLIYKMLNIFNCDYIYDSLYGCNDSTDNPFKCFSFAPLMGLTVNQLNQLFFTDLLIIWRYILRQMKAKSQICYKQLWSEDSGRSAEPLLIPLKTTLLMNNRHNCHNSDHLWSQLLFTWSPTNHLSYIYGFTRHTYHYMEESTEHREMRLRKFSEQNITKPVHKDPNVDPKSGSFDQIVHKARPSRTYECEPTLIPSFMSILINKTNGLRVSAKPMPMYCRNRRAMYAYRQQRLGGSYGHKKLITNGEINDLDSQSHHLLSHQKTLFFPPPLNGLLGLKELNGWSSLAIPDKETIVTDSGKLKELDQLLSKLKVDGHRVLIYSQMTRMIDLLEEYMWHRKHTYIRLDGSSKIADRRDMVADFQNRSDIFVFLLSTRAGGLGINLTAADTVIFYDSDWNPTVDQQAMDRAHRLGQTKQVTVYRLVCKGTIEEKILQRAQEKSEIQRMVISGGSFRPDTLRATEVVSLLLDDEELERRFQLKQEERRREMEESGGAIIGTPIGKTVKRKLKSSPKETDVSKKKYTKRLLSDNETESLYKDISPTGADVDSFNDNDSFPTSPFSEQSYRSLIAMNEDESNDGTITIDDRSSPTSSASDLHSPSSSSARRGGSSRGRGRPRGSRSRISINTRGSLTSAALAAAELAGAQAGKCAALAAYPFLNNALKSTGGTDTEGLVSSIISRRGRGRSRSTAYVAMRGVTLLKPSITDPIVKDSELSPPQTSSTSIATPIHGVEPYVHQDS